MLITNHPSPLKNGITTHSVKFGNNPPNGSTDPLATKPAAPVSFLESSRQSVLKKVFLRREDKPVSGADIFQLTYDVLTEKNRSWIPAKWLEDYLISFGEDATVKKQRAKELVTALQELAQVDLIIYQYSSDDGWYVKKTDVGRKIQGEPVSVSGQSSTLQRIKKIQGQDLESFAEEVNFSKLKVLTADYLKDVTGWDVLKLVQEVNGNRFFLKRFLNPGVPAAMILKNFTIPDQKTKIQQALRDLKDLGLLDETDPVSGKTETRWVVTKPGKTTIEEGDPIKNGLLTAETLNKILDNSIDKIRKERLQEQDSLRKFEADAEKALSVVKKLEEVCTAEEALALSTLQRADQAGSPEQKATLEKEAVLHARTADEARNKIELEAEFCKLLEDQVKTARDRFGERSKQADARLKRLVTAQAKQRITQIRGSVQGLIKDLEEMKAQNTVTQWSTVEAQAELAYYMAKADQQLDTQEQELRDKAQAIINQQESQAILQRLRASTTHQNLKTQ